MESCAGKSPSWKMAGIIILTSAEDPYTLLQNFDVSTHQVALSSDGELVKGPRWTPPTKPPVELRSGTLTSERMRKIERRYSRMRHIPQTVADSTTLRDESQTETFIDGSMA